MVLGKDSENFMESSFHLLESGSACQCGSKAEHRPSLLRRRVYIRQSNLGGGNLPNKAYLLYVYSLVGEVTEGVTCLTKPAYCMYIRRLGNRYCRRMAQLEDLWPVEGPSANWHPKELPLGWQTVS